MTESERHVPPMGETRLKVKIYMNIEGSPVVNDLGYTMVDGLVQEPTEAQRELGAAYQFNTESLAKALRQYADELEGARPATKPTAPEDRLATPEKGTRLVDLAREAPMNGLSIRHVIDSAVIRGLIADSDCYGEPELLNATLDAITEDTVAAVAKLVEIALDQQDVGTVGIGALALTELIFQAPVMSMEQPEPDDSIIPEGPTA